MHHTNLLVRITIASCGLALAGALSACATDQDQNAEAENSAADHPAVDKGGWPEKVPSNGLAKGLSLPLEDYMQSYSDQVTIDEAVRAKQTGCMAEYGFTVDLPPAGTTPPPNDNDMNIERRYGITDRAQAGYGLPSELADQTRKKLPKMSPEAVEVFTGRTGIGPDAPRTSRSRYNGVKLRERGCAEWGVQQVGADDVEHEFVAELAGQSYFRSQEEPAVRKVISTWSQCMSGKGVKVADPLRAMTLVPHSENGPSQREVAVAVADIDCKKKTDLVAVWAGAEEQIQRQQIKDNLATLKKINTERKTAISAAHAVVN